MACLVFIVIFVENHMNLVAAAPMILDVCGIAHKRRILIRYAQTLGELPFAVLLLRFCIHSEIALLLTYEPTKQPL